MSSKVFLHLVFLIKILIISYNKLTKKEYFKSLVNRPKYSFLISYLCNLSYYKMCWNWISTTIVIVKTSALPAGFLTVNMELTTVASTRNIPKYH